MNADKAERRWSVKQPPEFVQFCVFGGAIVNQCDFMVQFELAVKQAYTDLKRYIWLALGYSLNDNRSFSEVRGTSQCLQQDARQCLFSPQAFPDGSLDRSGSRYFDLPFFRSAPIFPGGFDPLMVGLELAAIGRSIAIENVSRLAQAFCLTGKASLDLLLSRMIEFRGPRASDLRAIDDRVWNGGVGQKVMPHPDVSEIEAEAVAVSFFVRTGNATLKNYRAVAYHLPEQPGLLVDPVEDGRNFQQIFTSDCEAIHEDNG